MCHFGCLKKQEKKPEEKFVSPSAYTDGTINKSNEFSSPSKMKTIELTEVYEVPSKNHATAEDVIAAKGFQILSEEIGSGSFATVLLAKRIKDDLALACKKLQFLDAARQAKMAIKNELWVMERVDHPYIIKTYGHFIVDVAKQARFVFIFMQLAEGDSLSVYMRQVNALESPLISLMATHLQVKVGLPEATCRRMFAQQVSAVNHMHLAGISHRDLKMGNILLDKQLNCLVADFGLSRVSFQRAKGGTKKSSRFCGTMSYMAPEILLTKEYSIKYCPYVADIWALGVILFCIVNHGYPFAEGPTMLQQQMKHRIRMGKKTSFSPNEQLMDLFYRLLDPNVELRIRMRKLMKHPYIAEEVAKIENAIKEGELQVEAQSAPNPLASNLKSFSNSSRETLS